MLGHVWKSMKNLMDNKIKIRCVWVPSHCSIEGNELADEQAAVGVSKSSLTEQQIIPLTLEATKTLLKPKIKQEYFYHTGSPYRTQLIFSPCTSLVKAACNELLPAGFNFSFPKRREFRPYLHELLLKS